MPGVKRAVLTAALAALFAPGLFAADMQNAPSANPAVPGTLNYVEGVATLNDQPVNQRSVGSAAAEPGQVLATGQGRAEMLLTPGIFLRLGNNSAAKMVSPSLTSTAVEIERGHAAIEVDQLFKENDVHVLLNHVPVQLVKTGLYEFDADKGAVRVFDGKAAVPRGDGKWTTIKGGHELLLAEGTGMKPAKFDKDAAEQAGLYKWSSLRSQYLAEANQQIAGQYAGYGPGWYWNPYAWNYTYLGMDPFFSPFGWGFYPLGYAGWGWGGGWGGGWYGGRVYGGHPYNGGHVNLPRGGFGGSALRGGGAGFHGGGGGAHMSAGGFGGHR